MIANVGMDEKEIGIEREGHTETGIGTGTKTDIVAAWEMKRIMVMIGSEIGGRRGKIVMVGSTGRDICTQQHQSKKTGMELRIMALKKK